MDFDHDAGWVTVPDILSAAQVAGILDQCQDLLDLPAAERLARDRPHSGTRHLDDLHTRIATVEQLVSDSALTVLVSQVLQGSFTVDQAHFRCPQPGYGEQSLHADGMTGYDPTQNGFVTAIVALTEFTEVNGATRLLPGSHLRPDLQQRSGTLASHPDEIRLTGPAGTAFVFGGGVLHAGAKNNSTAERPALQLIWRS